MSRSYRKHDYHGNGGSSEKDDKRIANRVLRHNVKRLLHVDPELEVLPIMREVSDRWNMNKDGKSYFGDLLSEHQTRSQLFPRDEEYWKKMYRDLKNK
jgi:hypothetical protein